MGVLFDPNVPLGKVQIRYQGRVIAEFECDPNDSAEILRRQNEEVQKFKDAQTASGSDAGAARAGGQ